MGSFYYGQPAADAIAKLNALEASVTAIGGGATPAPTSAPSAAVEDDRVALVFDATTLADMANPTPTLDHTAAIVTALAAVPTGRTACFPAGKHVRLTNLSITRDLVLDFNYCTLLVDPTPAGVTTGSAAIRFAGSLGTAYPITAMSARGTTITLATPANAANFAVGDTVVLTDAATTAIWTGSGSTTGRGEPNVVVSSNSTTGKVELLYTTEWPYATSPTMAKATPLTRVGVKNITSLTEVDPGGVFTGTDLQAAPHAIQFYLCNDPQVENVKASGLNLAAVNFDTCITPDAKNVVVSYPLRPTTSGHGVGVMMWRTREGRVAESAGVRLRHLFNPKQSYGCGSVNCLATNPVAGAFATGGLGERRTWSHDDSVFTSDAQGGGTGWAVGNAATSGSFGTAIIRPRFAGSGLAIVVAYKSDDTIIADPHLVGVAAAANNVATTGIVHAAGATNTRVSGGTIDMRACFVPNTANTSARIKALASDPAAITPDTLVLDGTKLYGGGSTFGAQNLVENSGNASLTVVDCDLIGTAGGANVALAVSGALTNLVVTGNRLWGGPFTTGFTVGTAPTGQYRIVDNSPAPACVTGNYMELAPSTNLVADRNAPDTVKQVDWSAQSTFDITPTEDWAGHRLEYALVGDTILSGPTLAANVIVPDNHMFDMLLVQDAIGSRALTLSGSSLLRVAGATAAVRTGYIPNRFVNVATGNDNNDGTKATQGAGNVGPYKTIQRALINAAAGHVIEVADGTYPESPRMHSVNGTPGAPIIVYAKNKWGAKLIPPAGNTLKVGFDVVIDNFILDGLEIDGTIDPSGSTTKWQWGVYVGGNNALVKNCHVHHIARTSAMDANGGGGIDLDNFFVLGAAQSAVGNLIHHIGPVGGDPNAFNSYWGIYTTASGGVVANNVIHNCLAHGVYNYHGGWGNQITFNTIFACGADGIRTGGGDIPTGLPPQMDNMVVENNICVNNAGKGINEVASFIGTGNYYVSNLCWNNTGGNTFAYKSTFTGTISFDPQFTNYQADGSGDYTLKATSPAVGKAVDSHAPDPANPGNFYPSYSTTDDYNHVARTSPADIGAYKLGTYTAGSLVDDTDTDDASLPTPTLYVDGVNGLDTYNGKSLTVSGSTGPFKTIQKALNTAKAGDVVSVEPGIYRETLRQTNYATFSGTPTSPVIFQSRVKWGAKLMIPTGNTSIIGADIRSDFFILNGFEFDGTDVPGTTSWLNGPCLTGVQATITRCHAHHIARSADGLNGQGGSGLQVDTYYGASRTDAYKDKVFGQVITRCYVHHVGPATGPNELIQGIYSNAIQGGVTNCLVHNVSDKGIGIQFWHDSKQDMVLNNTCFANGIGLLIGGGDFVTSGLPRVHYNSVMSNNIAYRNRLNGIKEHGYCTGNYIGYNCSVSNGGGTDAENYLTDALTSGSTTFGGTTYTYARATFGPKITADPQFINYNDNGTGDYRLAVGSPCIAAGDPSRVGASVWNAVDYNGKPHPTPPSLGCYRFVPKAPPAVGVKLSLSTAAGSTDRLVCRWSQAHGVYYCELFKGYV